jgi:hypothetical protein
MQTSRVDSVATVLYLRSFARPRATRAGNEPHRTLEQSTSPSRHRNSSAAWWSRYVHSHKRLLGSACPVDKFGRRPPALVHRWPQSVALVHRHVTQLYSVGSNSPTTNRAKRLHQSSAAALTAAVTKAMTRSCLAAGGPMQEGLMACKPTLCVLPGCAVASARVALQPLEPDRLKFSWRVVDRYAGAPGPD